MRIFWFDAALFFFIIDLLWLLDYFSGTEPGWIGSLPGRFCGTLEMVGRDFRQQTQTIQYDQNCAAFMPDHSKRKVDQLEQVGQNQYEDDGD